MTLLVNKSIKNCNILKLIKTNEFVKYINVLKLHNICYGNCDV